MKHSLYIFTNYTFYYYSFVPCSPLWTPKWNYLSVNSSLTSNSRSSLKKMYITHTYSDINIPAYTQLLWYMTLIFTTTTKYLITNIVVTIQARFECVILLSEWYWPFIHFVGIDHVNKRQSWIAMNSWFVFFLFYNISFISIYKKIKCVKSDIQIKF